MEKENKWKILKNVVPKNTILDNCASSITGICSNVKTVQECVNECEKSDKCNYGYYVRGKNESVCLPMNSELHYDNYNPTYNWVKNGNPEISTFAFLNTDEIPFPDTDSNSAFFNDVIYLKNSKGYFLYSKIDTTNLKDISSVQFTEKPNEKTPLKISLLNPYNPDFISNASLRKQVPFVFSIDKTGYILRKNRENNDMTWVFRGGIEILVSDQLKIIPLIPNENDIFYGQKFYIQYLQGFLGISDDNKLTYYPGELKKGENMVFSMESNHAIYSCVKNRCQEIPDIDGINRTIMNPKYKGQDTFRSENCFGACGYEKEGKKGEKNNSIKIPLIISVLFMFCIFFTFLIIFIIFIRPNKK